MALINDQNLDNLKSLISENQKIRYTQVKFIERFLKLYSRAQNFNNFEVRVFQAHEELSDYDTIEIGQFKTWMIQKTRFFKDDGFYEPLLFFIRSLNTQIELNSIENAYFEFRDFAKTREYEKPRRVESSWERPLEHSLNENSRIQIEQFPVVGQANPRVAGYTNPRVADSKLDRNSKTINSESDVTFMDSVTLSVYRNISNPTIKEEFRKVFGTIGFDSEINNLSNDNFSLIKTVEDNVTLKIYRGMKLDSKIVNLISDVFESINMISECKLWRSKLSGE
jgi:hypothetical protein